ncbi:hypothetical protein JS528_06920 [Bifidobacterium sp. MA2]|uniref:Uncharacterized protein n=1 Tax=Bifidobacterium santillanense TaxID=2809028 RepID=A0ABS5UQD7_9BIFI|nr:hypothetical protein [Bifidobacterium santillanense]MBT1173086.1 hypothetical protein [Bifidobacterium santillanense]
MQSTIRTGKGHAVIAVVSVVMLLLGMLTGTAYAAESNDGYITIGGVQVSRALGVTTEAQLEQRYSEGYLEVDFNERAEITAARPLTDAQMAAARQAESQSVAARSGTRVPCRSTDVCLTFTNGGQRGFYDTGIRAGNWTNVATSNSGKWYAKYRILYKGETHVSPVVGPYTIGRHYGNTINQVTIVR